MNQNQITTLEKVKSVGLRGCFKHFKYKEPDLFLEIEKCHGVRFVERLYNYVYGKSEHKCEQCKIGEVNFRSFNRGYAFFCSNKCIAVNNAHKKKKKKTNQERFGTDKPSQNKAVDQKRKDTLIKKYGTSNLADIRWSKEK